MDKKKKKKDKSELTKEEKKILLRYKDKMVRNSDMKVK